MYSSKPVLVLLFFGLLTLVGFGIAAWSAGERPFGVLLGTLAALADIV